MSVSLFDRTLTDSDMSVTVFDRTLTESVT